MKHNLLIVLIGLITVASEAQTLTPQVTSSAGTSFNNGANVLDWTLGEPSTATLINGNNILSQGFHQSNLLAVCICDLADGANNEVTVFPNPTADIVQLHFTKANEINIVELYSLEGKLLSSQSVNSTSTSQVEMTKYNSGTYILKIKNVNRKDKSYQIIKTK